MAGRPSKLTPEQWEMVDKRIALGEQANLIAADFGIHRSQVSRRFKGKIENRTQEAAHALAALPLRQMAVAITLADELRTISSNLAAAGRYGASTAHRMSRLANAQAEKIDETAPLDSEGAFKRLKDISALTQVANDSAKTGLGLLAATRDRTPAQSEPHPLVLNGSDLDG